MRSVRTWLVVAIVHLLVASVAIAATEEVTVAQADISSDTAIIVRRNGDAFEIEKGVGCLSLWRYVGRAVIVSSPGLFLGVGSELIIPDAGQRCRIWNSTPLGRWTGGRPTSPSPQPTPVPAVSPFSPLVVADAQRALVKLGLYSGRVSGVLDLDTMSSLRRFQLGSNLSPSGVPDATTLLQLATALLPIIRGDPEAGRIGLALLEHAEQMGSAGRAPMSPTPGPTPATPTGRCIESLITDISRDGFTITLLDGSVWQVNPVDSVFTTVWLPYTRVSICGDRMINLSIGREVRVLRLR